MVETRSGIVLAERYTLHSRLGSGAMGVVWEARDERLGRPVAVKTVASELLNDDEALERFEREAKAIAQLRSPHIVEVYDYGVDHGVAFMVMEMLEGEDLSKRLRNGKRLSLENTAHVIDQISRGLTSAHRAGIVHRDLKPANIYLVRDQDREVVKVFDFGVAGFIRQERARQLTEEGTIIGTPRYMSPEHLMGKPSDPRDDVWALALIAYRCICGAAGYRAQGIAELVQAIGTEMPPPPSSHVAALSAQVDELFERAFTKVRKERFNTASDFAEALRDLAGVKSSGLSIEVVGHDRTPASERPTRRVTPEEFPTQKTMARSTTDGSGTRSLVVAALAAIAFAFAVFLFGGTDGKTIRDSGATTDAKIGAKPENTVRPVSEAMPTVRVAPSASAGASPTSSTEPSSSAPGPKERAPAKRPAQPSAGDEMFETVF